MAFWTFLEPSELKELNANIGKPLNRNKFLSFFSSLLSVQIQTKFKSMHVWVYVTRLKGALSPVAHSGQVT